MVALAGELGLEGPVVLDDAVVDQREVVVLGAMGVRIDVARLAVRGPAGVGDADAAGDILAGSGLLQVLHLSFGLVDGEIAAIADQRHSGAVVAPVLKPGEPFDQDRIGLTAPYVSYDSTHILSV